MKLKLVLLQIVTLVFPLIGCSFVENVGTQPSPTPTSVWEVVEPPQIRLDVLTYEVYGEMRYTGSERLNFAEVECQVYRDETLVASARDGVNGLRPNAIFAYESFLVGDYWHQDGDEVDCFISTW